MGPKGEVRKRGVAVDELIGLLDDGTVVHIPSGFIIKPPRDAAGKHRPVADPLAWIKAFLQADEKGWARSRSLEWQAKMSRPLQEQLLAVVEGVVKR